MDDHDKLLRTLAAETFSSTRHPGLDQARELAEIPVTTASDGRQRTERDARRLLLRVEDVADLLDVGRTRVYELIKSGALHSVKIGGSRRIPTAALHRFMQSLMDSAS